MAQLSTQESLLRWRLCHASRRTPALAPMALCIPANSAADVCFGVIGCRGAVKC
jgi:hypothetical protein